MGENLISPQIGYALRESRRKKTGSPRARRNDRATRRNIKKLDEIENIFKKTVFDPDSFFLLIL